MKNLSSCCGLVDAKIRASDKDLPVLDDVVEDSVPRLCDKVRLVLHFFLGFLELISLKLYHCTLQCTMIMLIYMA